jgi:hypothetical protein
MAVATFSDKLHLSEALSPSSALHHAGPRLWQVARRKRDEESDRGVSSPYIAACCPLIGIRGLAAIYWCWRNPLRC